MGVNVGSKKQLAVILSKLKGFSTPKVRLEQYATDSETAADVLWNAFLLKDVENKRVLDLGAGSGILGLGCLLLGAAEVDFIDIDPEALKDAEINLSKLKSEGFELGEARLRHCDARSLHGTWDTVIQNPPFGTRQEGADSSFLVQASTLGTITYSFHKTSTATFIEERIRALKGQVTHVFAYDLLLPRTYAHQTKSHQRIKVSVWRISFFDHRKI